MNPVLLLTLILSSILGAISFAGVIAGELFLAQLSLGGSFILGLLAALIDALQDDDRLRANRPLTPKERQRLEAQLASRTRGER